MKRERLRIAEEHVLLTRRYFLQVAGTGLAATSPLLAAPNCVWTFRRRRVQSGNTLRG